MNHDSNIDNAFIERIVEEYTDMILRLAMHHVRNRSEAEDITQKVFLKVLKVYPSFQSQEHEKAWILRVTINLCKDYFKSSWFRKITSMEEHYSTGFQEYKGELLSVVQKLPQKYRNVIYLYYYEEMSITEVSRILGVKEGTIMSWLHRARAKLKVMLKGEFDYE
jgi:RNA polymerase sigma-70 factor, ECF subfamily